MSGGGTTTTTVANKDPWGPAQGYLQDIMGQSAKLYDSGAGSQVWNGALIPGVDPFTSEAMGGTANLARQQAPLLQGPYAYGNTIMANQGIAPSMQPALGTLGGVASGASGIDTAPAYARLANSAFDQDSGVRGTLGGLTNAYGDVAGTAPGANADVIGGLGSIAFGAGIPDTTALQSLYNRSQNQNQDATGIMQALAQSPQIGTGSDLKGIADMAPSVNTDIISRLGSMGNVASGSPTAADRYLTGMAGGSPTVNPYMESLLQDNANIVGNRVASEMSGMGRYGSAGMGNAVARGITAANAPILTQAYENDQGRRLAATGQIDAAREAANATALGSYGAAAGLRNANVGNELAATNALSGVEMQNAAQQLGAAQTLGGLRQSDTSLGAGLLGDIGNMQNAATANRINAGTTIAGLRNQNLGTELSALGGAANTATGLGANNRADLSTALSALGGQTGVEGTNIGNQLGASQNLLGALGSGLDRSAQWASMLPTLAGAEYLPYRELGSLGAYNENRIGNLIAAQQNQFNQQQAMPWTQLNRYLGGVSGLGNIIAPATSTAGTTTTQNMTPWTTYAGLGLAGLGLLSDRNSKTDIEPVAVDPHTGLNLYAYRYKGDPKSYPKVLGPMAQDVAEKFPGMVERVGGLLSIKPTPPWSA